tara:strand:+ start:1372 stop:2340 length:969 start_codon:yes stop_codon:yes gene_type:complete
MVKYECFRCGYTNNIKSRIIKHLNRKFICKPINNDINIDEIYKYYFNKTKINVPQKPSKFTQKNSFFPQKNSLFPQKTSLTCKFCRRCFKRNDNLKRHLNSCKVKKDKNDLNNLQKLVNLLNEQLKEQKDDLKKEFTKELKKKDKEYEKKLKKKDKLIEELIKKTGVNIEKQTNNIQNNIKILAYKNTDISHLKDTDYIKFLSHSNFCVPHMIKKLHFDKKKPENHNIYISNLKNNFVMIYDGVKWNIKDRNEIINDMIEDNTNILEDKIEDWLEKGKQYPQIMKKFNRYLEKKENDIVLDKIKQEMKFILYNNRKIVNEEN